MQGALQHKGYATHDRTIQGRRVIHDKHMIMRFHTTVSRTTQDRAPPLTHRRAARVN